MRASTRTMSCGLCLVGLAGVLGLAPEARADPLDPLYGTWTGTWFVEQMFTSAGPLGSPPYPPAPVVFRLHAFGVGGEAYGTLEVGGAIGGIVTALSLQGSELAATVTYPTVPGPNNTGILTAAWFPGSISGRLDEPTNPPPGWTSWRGTVSLGQYGGCYANCDGSTIAPVLNVADFTCFLNAFASGEGYANCDRSTVPPVLNVADFVCFLNRFATGCS